jgi:hypothetical protein
MRIVVAPPVPNEFVIRVPGPQGPKGDKGTLWLSGTTAPAAGLGLIDDWYLNTITGDTYQKTGLTTWVQTGNIKGATGTINVGSVTTGTAGSSVVVTNVGTPTNAIFNFTIPKGDKGDRATLAVGTVTTGAPGSAAAVTDTGTASDGILNFTIPRGDTGATGTLSLGTVTTGTPGSSVIITNTGTPTAGVFNFTIPRGDVGPQGVQGVQGDPGPVGPAGLTWRGAWSNAATYAINDHVTWGGSSYYSTTTKAAGQAPPTGTAADPGTDDTAVNAGWALLTMQGATGPQGPQGPQGIQGIQGPQGATGIAEVWYSGAGAPSGATGAVGDWYLNTTNGDVYEKTGASAWTLRANITGPQGPQGIQGIQGPAGSSVNAIFTTSTAAGVPIISRGSASQTGDLFQWQDSASTVLGRISAAGGIATGNTLSVGSASVNTGSIFYLNTTSAANIGMVVQGAASQTANLVEYKDNAGTILASVANSGTFSTSGRIVVGTSIGSGLDVNNVGQPSRIAVTIRAAASQTAGLTEWQLSDGTIKASINQAGDLWNRGLITVGPSAPFANNTFLVTPLAAGYVGATIRGVSGQTSDLQQWQDNTGTTLAVVTAYGSIKGQAVVAGSSTASAGSTPFWVLNNVTTSPASIIRGVASQTANLTEWQDSGGTALSYIKPDGAGSFGGNTFINQLGVGTSGLSGVRHSVLTYSTSVIGSVIRGMAGQTADLQQWQNSTPSTMASIDNAGRFAAARITAGDSSASTASILYVKPVTAGTGSSIVSIFAGMSSQSGNLTEWQDNSGTVLGSVSPGGAMVTGTGGPIGGTRLSVNPAGAGIVGVGVKAAASQTADLQQWLNSAGTVLSRVANDGTIWVGATQLGGGGAGNAADTEIMTIMGGF